jgi:hypothetical protein
MMPWPAGRAITYETVSDWAVVYVAKLNAWITSLEYERLYDPNILVKEPQLAKSLLDAFAAKCAEEGEVRRRRCIVVRDREVVAVATREKDHLISTEEIVTLHL